MKYYLFPLFLALLVFCTACGRDEVVADSALVNGAEKQSKTTANSIKRGGEAEEITWDELIPEGYDPNAIIGKYQAQLESLEDDDPKAMEIYGLIQAELDNADVNPELDGRNIRMPGFIAPLENVDGTVTEFLLVPYFGACIHVPPPPVNQTVMVTAADGQGIDSDEAYLPIWIEGEVSVKEQRTGIGVAGYIVDNAKIRPYELE